MNLFTYKITSEYIFLIFVLDLGPGPAIILEKKKILYLMGDVYFLVNILPSKYQICLMFFRLTANQI